MKTPRALIEEELPLEQVDRESGREKSIRHGNISTMHLWWARRPLAMSRAVVFGSLLPDPGKAERGPLLKALSFASSFEAASQPQFIGPLRDALRGAWPDQRPKVLDCFAGGGAIPLEAQRLGCEVTATDVNPVAHLVQCCVLQYPGQFGHVDGTGSFPFVDEFVHWAQWVQSRADAKMVEVFPRPAPGSRIGAYFWARTVLCGDPQCGRRIPIISSRKLVDTKKHKVRVDYEVKDDWVELAVNEGRGLETADWSRGTKTSHGSSVTVTCPACGTARPDKELRAHSRQGGLGVYMYAVMEVTRDGTRLYRKPTQSEREAADMAQSRLDALPDYPEGTSAAPDEGLVKSQYRRYPNITYGFDTWASMFLPRQRFSLAILAQTVREAHEEMLAVGLPDDRALALTTYLALLVDRIADYNSTFCKWVPAGQFVAHTFPQQSIQMSWDFPEIDPCGQVSGNWTGAIDWVRRALMHCCTAAAGNPARVLRANAQDLPFGDGEFDAVIIDPPYYDAFQYGDLSDYFYVWLKRSIGHLYPELFVTPLTPKHAEVIENRADKRSAEYISHEEFELRLQRALDEVARVVSDDGIVSLVFAHTDVAAWERLLVALRRAGLLVTTSWPMRSERSARPTALISAVLSSSVVLVCRKSTAAQEGFYDDVVRALEERIEERLATFEEMRLTGADYFVSAVGPAFEVFAQYSRVVRLSGEEVSVEDLIVLARQAVARHAMRRLLGGESLAAMDDRSLLYLTWRWAYDGLAIPSDEAYMLCRAFDVELDVLSRTGMVRKEGTGSELKFRLLGPAERKQIDLGPSPVIIDVLHVACQLHDTGRRAKVAEVLATTGTGNEPAFWATASAIAQALPDGNRERTLLLGLMGGREALSGAASVLSANEQRPLF